MSKIPSTIFALHSRMKNEFPEKIATQYYDEKKESVISITYSEYYEDICRFVTYLRSNGISRRSHVALIAKNSYAYMVAVFGIILADCVLVPINPDASAEEIRFEIDHSDASFVIGDGYCNIDQIDINGYKYVDVSSIEDKCDLNSLCMILYTSGTTGTPRGVMICQKNILAFLKYYYSFGTDLLELLDTDYFGLSRMSVLPMYHVAELDTLVGCALFGSTVIINLDLRKLFRDLTLMNSSMMAAPPVLVNHILDTVEKDPALLPHIPLLGCISSKAHIRAMTVLHNKGVLIAQNYAMTETFGFGLFNVNQDPNSYDSVGVEHPEAEYRILNNELCLRGEFVMMGYYKDPSATEDTIDSEGWLHTGDYFTADEKGYYYIIGRKKNLIILDSGENVSPEELEGLIMKIELVKDVIVYEKERKICANIFCDEKSRDRIAKEVHEINKILPRYKQITLIEFSQYQHERNATGKEKRH